jgi:enamine deaminase RidA (YjgF/YER057c/UK114 family)
MMRKNVCQDVGHSIVEFGDVRYFFAVAAPRRGTTFRQQAEDVMQTIESLIQEAGTPLSMVMQSVFLRELNDQTVFRQLLHNHYGKELPATSYIHQPPCAGKMLAIEVMGVGPAASEVEIERAGDGLVVTRHSGITWAHLANIQGGSAADSVYDRSLSTFHLAHERLASAGFGFDEVIRTWLYLGDITGPEGESLRYSELNRARSDYYRKLKFSSGLIPHNCGKPAYPASTGIGALGSDVTISCIAMKADRPDIVLAPLENPRQTSSCDYLHQYGTGRPKFSRAMVVAADNAAMIFISGTASITASETRHHDDLKRQTQQTLDNIEALISSDNLRTHGLPDFGSTLGDLALVRVYLKRHEDYASARTICRARLGEMPTIYALGDICRPDLLVEIEGIAFSRRQSPWSSGDSRE